MENGAIIYWLLLLLGCLVAIVPPPPLLAQDLELSDLPYYSKIAAGKDNVFFFEVRNNGYVPVTNIRLSSYQPEGWVVEFKPGQIDYLGPRSFQTVDVNIKPTAKTTEGEYRVTLVATANETRKVRDIQVRVETSKAVWLWIGGILAFVVAAAFTIVFLRYGRQ